MLRRARASLPMNDDARERAGFLDLLRVLAAVQMVQGHTIDALLSPRFRAGGVYDAWTWGRGLTAVAFLWAAGVAFHVSTVRRYERHRTDVAAVRRRFRRAGMLVLLGYLLHFPFGIGSEDPIRRAEALSAFVAIDVLQCVGVSIAILEGLALLLRARAAFVAACALLGVGLLVAAPVAHAVAAGSLPAPLWHYLTPHGGSLFPLFPWAGHVFLGVGVAAWIDVPGRRARALRLLGAAGVSLVASEVLRAWGSSALVADHLQRLGWVLAAATALVCVEALKRPPQWVARLAGETLFVYVFHVVLVYGDGLGLGALAGGALDPVAAGLVAAVLIGLSLGLAHAWARPFGARRPRLAGVAAPG